jgi:hypothetical protein
VQHKQFELGREGGLLKSTAAQIVHGDFIISSSFIARILLERIRRIVMGNRTVFWVVFALLLIAALAGVGYYSYSAGVAHGIVESGRAGAGGAAPVVVVPRWGFGFPFFPFFFILLWIFLLRGLFWRGRRWGRGCGYGYGSGVPPQFEEWHRRACGPTRNSAGLRNIKILT